MYPTQLSSARSYLGGVALLSAPRMSRLGSGSRSRCSRLSCGAALDSMEQQYAKTAKKALVSVAERVSVHVLCRAPCSALSGAVVDAASRRKTIA